MGDIIDLLPDFNPKEDAKAVFQLLPEGKYPVEILDALIKTTSDFTGKNLNLKLQVLGHRNIIYDCLCIINNSERAVQMARQKLARLCNAANIAGKDTAELIGAVVVAEVEVQPPQNRYEAKNVIKAYYADDMPQEVKSPESKETPPKAKETAQEVQSDDDDEPPF